MRSASKRSRILALAGAIAVILSPFTAATSALADDPTFTVSGTLTNPEAAGQYPTVDAFGADDSTPVATSIANNGYFALDLPNGNYKLRASGDGFKTTWYQDAADFADATSVTVANEDVSGVDFELPRAKYVVSGTVSGGTPLTPLAGQSVELYDGSNQLVQTTATNDSGHYAFDGLYEQSYMSVHFVGGGGWAQEWYDGKYEESDATQFDLDADKTINQTLARTGGISGRVTSATSGAAVAGADVTIEDKLGYYVADMATTSTGAYSITGIPVGSYKVSVVGPDHDSLGTDGLWDETWYGGATRLGAAKVVTVHPDSGLTGINVKLVRDIKITGTIVDKSTNSPLRSDLLNLVSSSGKTVQTVFSNDDGSYRFDTVKPGSYRVQASGDDQTSDFHADAGLWWGGVGSASAKKIEVTSTRGASGINFTLPLAGFVSGTIDTPLDFDPYAKAELLTTSGQVVETGDVELNQWNFGAPAGTYVVRFISKDGYYESSYYPNKPTRASAQRIVLVGGAFKTVADVSFAHAVLGAIHGVVKSGDGTSVSGLTVTPSRTPTTFYKEAVPDTTAVDADGSFLIKNVPAGTYTLDFGTDGSLQPEQYSDRFPTQDATVVTVKAGTTAKLATQTVYQTVSISGNVTENGDPASAHVEFFDASKRLVAVADTDGDGSYSVQVRPGKYRIRFGDDNSPVDPDDPSAAPNDGAVWYGNAASESTSKLFDASSTSSEADAVLTAGKGSSIHGIAVDSKTKLPADFLTVILWREEPDGTWYQRDGEDTITDGTGHYSIPGLGIGTYRVSFSDDPYNQYETSWDGKSHTIGGADNILVRTTASTTTAPTAYMLRG